MSCQRLEKSLWDAAAGVSSPGAAAHLSTCGSCRAALAAERALLDRIDSELQESLDIQPSMAFLPAVRRRVAEVRAERDTTRRWWPVPALATLAGILAVGHLMIHTAPTPTLPVPSTARPAEGPAVRAAVPFEPMTTRAREGAPASIPQEVAVRDTRQDVAHDNRLETTETQSMPRVFVPPEDAEAVRRLALRLRGHAARAAVMGPDVEGPFDFTLKPIEERPEVVTVDHRVPWGTEPSLEEPPSFDRILENAGRET